MGTASLDVWAAGRSGDRGHAPLGIFCQDRPDRPLRLDYAPRTGTVRDVVDLAVPARAARAQELVRVETRTATAAESLVEKLCDRLGGRAELVDADVTDLGRDGATLKLDVGSLSPRSALVGDPAGLGSAARPVVGDAGERVVGRRALFEREPNHGNRHG